ncbi:MAG: hypothetical protein WBV78_03360 [Roseobacter sp.]
MNNRFPLMQMRFARGVRAGSGVVLGMTHAYAIIPCALPERDKGFKK